MDFFKHGVEYRSIGNRCHSDVFPQQTYHYGRVFPHAHITRDVCFPDKEASDMCFPTIVSTHTDWCLSISPPLATADNFYWWIMLLHIATTVYFLHAFLHFLLSAVHSYYCYTAACRYCYYCCLLLLLLATIAVCWYYYYCCLLLQHYLLILLFATTVYCRFTACYYCCLLPLLLAATTAACWCCYTACCCCHLIQHLQ